MRRATGGLRRSGTLQAQIERPSANAGTPSPPNAEEEFAEEEPEDEEADYQYARQTVYSTQGQGQYTPNSVGRSSPWSASSAEWKYASGMPNNGGGSAIDDVQRALASMELAGGAQGQTHFVQNAGFGGGLPPRLNQHGMPVSINQAPNMRRMDNNNGNGMVHPGSGMIQHRSSKLQLVTDVENGGKGPASAAASVPPIGHTIAQQQQQGGGHYRGPSNGSAIGNGNGRDDRVMSATGTWDQKERVLSSRSSNSNLHYNGGYDASGLPPNPPIPPQYLAQQAGQAPRLGVMTAFGQGGQAQAQQASVGAAQQAPGFVNTPIDVPTLIATKGYNPTTFDCRPTFVSNVYI